MIDPGIQGLAGLARGGLASSVLGGLAGLALGGLYFGGLWATVRRVPAARRPALLVAGSYLVRLAILGIGLYAVVRMAGGVALVVALLGFLLVRQVMARRIAWS